MRLQVHHRRVIDLHDSQRHAVRYSCQAPSNTHYLEWKWLKPVVDAVPLTDNLMSALLVADSWYTVDTAPLVLVALPVKLRAVAGWPVHPVVAAGGPVKLGLAVD